MKIAVSADGANLDAQTSPRFGRCPMYVFVDSETMVFEAQENPAIDAPGGAGIQAAQFVVEHGAQAVVTGNTGPNAFSVFQSVGVPVYLFGGGTVREAVEAYRTGRLQVTGGASAPAHAGMGMGRGMGIGRGMGAGMGKSGSEDLSRTGSVAFSREQEMTALKEQAKELANTMEEIQAKIKNIEKG